MYWKANLNLSFGQKGHVAQINRPYDVHVLRQKDARIYALYILLRNSTTNTATYNKSAIRLNHRTYIRAEAAIL